MEDNHHYDVVLTRPFIPVLIKPKGKGQPRRATRLNVKRTVKGKDGEYHLVLIPYTEGEMIGRRLGKTIDISPLLPDAPGVEGVDYGARPQRMEWPACGHLQFVRGDRLEVSREDSPWAG